MSSQLEREVLVVRVQDAKDRRASSVKLTPAGWVAFAEMAAVHERWIEEMLADVPVKDKETMTVLLSTMKRRLCVDNSA